MTDTKLVTIEDVNQAALTVGGPLPELVMAGDRAGATAWDDFFVGKVRNRHTRLAYERHVRRFLTTVANTRKSLAEITAGDVGRYLRSLAPEKKSLSKKKQCLAALRKFFNICVERHLCIINPAAVAETERLTVTQGKTPIISYEQAFKLYEVIDRDTLSGKRDLAILATLNFSGARAGAVASLNVDDLYQAESQWVLHFDEKNNKSREIPVPHDLQQYLFDWLEASGLRDHRRKRDSLTGRWIPRPMFRTFVLKTNRLSDYRHEQHDPKTGVLLQSEKGRMSGRDITRMMKRRLKDADLPSNLSPHSYRVAIGSDLGDQDVPIADIQYYLGHSDPRTTQLYLRKKQEVSRNLVERIRVGRVKRV